MVDSIHHSAGQIISLDAWNIFISKATSNNMQLSDQSIVLFSIIYCDHLSGNMQ